MDSNHRRLSQQIYSLPPLTAREPLRNLRSGFGRRAIILKCRSLSTAFRHPPYQNSQWGTDEADNPIRTDDLLMTNQLPCQPSYTGYIGRRIIRSNGWNSSFFNPGVFNGKLKSLSIPIRIASMRHRHMTQRYIQKGNVLSLSLPFIHPEFCKRLDGDGRVAGLMEPSTRSSIVGEIQSRQSSGINRKGCSTGAQGSFEAD